MGWIWLAVSLGVVVAVVLAWRPVRRWARQSQAKHAREAFPRNRPVLEEEFLRAAGATGKPRGLRWKALEWAPEVEFARDRLTGLLTALVGVTVHFEAIAGSDMEGHSAVGVPRNATAVFFYRGGRWETVGRALFNLNPAEALDHFHGQFDRRGT